MLYELQNCALLTWIAGVSPTIFNTFRFPESYCIKVFAIFSLYLYVKGFLYTPWIGSILQMRIGTTGAHCTLHPQDEPVSSSHCTSTKPTLSAYLAPFWPRWHKSLAQIGSGDWDYCHHLFRLLRTKWIKKAGATKKIIKILIYFS